jgi:hypothetical protein
VISVTSLLSKGKTVMKTAMKVLAASALALGISLAAPVAEAWTGAPDGVVSNIQLSSDGSFSFSLSGDPVMCAAGNATNRRGAVWVGTYNGVTVTAEGARALLQTLLAAQLSGKRVRVYSNDNASTSGWGCRVGAIDLL